MVFDGGLFDNRGSRIVKPSDAEVERYAGPSRREFLKGVVAMAIATAAGQELRYCGGGSGGGGGPSPTMYNVSVGVEKTFGGGMLSPYSWNLGARSGTSSDGYLSASNVSSGSQALAIDNVPGAPPGVALRRETTLSIGGNNTDYSTKIDAIPAGYPFDVAHNNEMIIITELANFNGRFGAGVSPKVLMVRSYKADDGTTQYVGDNVLGNTKSAVTTLNEILAGLVTTTTEPIDADPTNQPDNTIIAHYNRSPSGGPVANSNGVILRSVINIPLYYDAIGNLHELLHALGFGHTTTKNSIMFGGPYPPGYGWPYPTQNDTDSIKWKYKRNAGATTASNIDKD